MKTLQVASLLLVLISLISRAEDVETIPARWQQREIQATFSGLRTAYNCDSVEHRIQRMLWVLGAHRNTHVLVTGCALSRLSSTFFIRISTATSVPRSQAGESDARQELLRRLGSKSVYGTTEFPAVWKTLDLSKIRELNFEPGDCELLQLIQDQILPKMGAEMSGPRLRCAPASPLAKLPALNVTVLVPAPAPDAKPQ
jgi:hypothetical protein